MRAFGNSWLDTQALYPQYRTREGALKALADPARLRLVSIVAASDGAEACVRP
jgi:hypothetical protein